MRTNRLLGMLFVFTFAAFALACGGAGGPGGSPEGEKKDDWRARLKAYRSTCEEKVAAADQRLKDAESAVADAKKKLKAEQSRTSTVGKMAAAKQAVKDAEEQVAVRKREADLDRRAARLDWGPVGIQAGRGVNTTGEAIKIVQVVAPDAAIVEWHGETLWWNLNTSGLVDGRAISLDGVSECVGTRQYVTALGATRTVAEMRYHGKE